MTHAPILPRLAPRALLALAPLLSLVAACATRTTPSSQPAPPAMPPSGPASPGALPAPDIPLDPRTDTARAEEVVPGVQYRYYWLSRGPWAVHVLDADRASCWSLAARKGAPGATGRKPTSVLLRELADSLGHDAVAGGVNADFFLFAPPGVPVGAHVEGGRMLSGPVDRPVVGTLADGRPWIGVLEAGGSVTIGDGGAGDARRPGDATWTVGGVNRVRPRTLAVLDRAWAARTDTASGRVEVVARGEPLRVVRVDTSVAGVDIPADGVVLVADTGVANVQALRGVRPGTRVSVRRSLSPVTPRELVGGFPVLLQDSVEPADLDSAGARSFGVARHPRTAVGIGAGGRRLLLVVVDGRQAHSAGMTLRELAEVMRHLGAREAINLDGGGSTAMVRRAGGAQAIANRPSDREGERPVANALALVRACGGRDGAGDRARTPAR